MHGYNSTCNLKVEGSTYLSFIEHYLRPLFNREVLKHKDKIIDSDKSIIKTLGGAASVRSSRSVQSIRSSINQGNVTCKTCDLTFNSSLHLRKHSEEQQLEKVIFTCDTCDYSSLDKPDLEMHIKSTHNNVQPSFNELNRNCDGNPIFVSIEELTCRKCDFESDNTKLLKKHIIPITISISKTDP